MNNLQENPREKQTSKWEPHTRRKWWNLSLQLRLSALSILLIVPFFILTMILVYNMNQIGDSYDRIVQNITQVNEYNLVFKDEMDADVQREVAGSLTWYNEMCYKFQMGHELVFSTVTGRLGYNVDDAEARIVKIACVDTVDGTLVFRVATKDDEGNVVPLTASQLLNFKNYVDAIKFAGTKSQVVSTSPDMVKYSIKVWYNPATPVDTVRSGVESALEDFRFAQHFGGIIYRHEYVFI